jgi:hypothetical protein
VTLDRYSHWIPSMGRIESTAALLLPIPRWSEQGILPFYRICR